MINEKVLIDVDSTCIANENVGWTRFENKTFLISGATGYVSQYLVHAILKRNDLYNSNIKVIALCRNADKAKKRFQQYMEREDFVIKVQDIFKEIEIVENVDFIIHAASPAGLVTSNINPVETFKVNVFGADNLLKLAEKNSADFLMFSSVDVYGKIDNERFVEDKLGYLDTMDPRNVYAYAKRAAENLAICYSKRGVNIKVVRPSQIMGGGVSLNDGRLHIDFISQILKEGKITLKGDGSPVRSFIYITDAISAILTVLSKGVSGQAYNVCNEEAEASVLEFAKIMAKCVKKDIPIEFNIESRKNNIEVKHAVSVVTASSDKIRQLGWKPKVSIEESCKKMMSYYGIELKNN